MAQNLIMVWIPRIRSSAFKELAKSFINNILLAMKFGSNVASNRFSRVLDLMADQDAGMDIPSYFKTQVIDTS